MVAAAGVARSYKLADSDTARSVTIDPAMNQTAGVARRGRSAVTSRTAITNSAAHAKAMISERSTRWKVRDSVPM